MLISIITINFNDVTGLKKTITSVLEQTYSNIEYIIIDGGSTDGSKDYIETNQDSLAYWVSEPDSGIYNAMNKGIDQATGNYLLFLNSGDWLVDNLVIEKFIGFNPVEDIVYGDTLLNDGNKLELLKMPSVMSIGVSLTHTLNHQTIFFNKTLFADGIRYDCQFKIVADWVFVNNAIIFRKCTTRHINLVVPNYDVNGVSSDVALRISERATYMNTNFNDEFTALLGDYSRLHKDLKNLRNKKIIKLLFQLSKIFNKLKFKS